MVRPFALLRAGFPYVKTLGMRRCTDFPVDVAVGAEGRIYVLLRQGVIRVWAFDDYETLPDLVGIGGRGSGDGQFQWPIAVITDRDENLFVADEGLHRISSFSMDGEFLGQWGEHGDGAGQLNRPAGIAFDAEENIYVSDAMNHRVQKFTKDGQFLLSWGELGDGEGQFNMPWGIDVDELGDVYVVDWRNDRLQKFTADGEFIFKIGGSGNGDDEFKRPTGVAVDGDGDIYVADCGNNKIKLFNEQGRYVQGFVGDATLSKVARSYMYGNAQPNRFREMANLDPEKYFRTPKSVRVDGQGRMFVPDFQAYRVQVYQKEAIPLDEAHITPELRSPSLNTV
jgi:DNA-binding beta-propeller fold protein YncE